MKIVMVCLGNICRSPLADALLRKKVAKLGLDVEVDSAGTSAYHIGNQPDERTRENALKHNLDISFLRARQFKKEDFQNFDLIYVMDRTNQYNVLELAETDEDREKVKLILEILPDEHLNEVPDPYYSGEQGFEVVYKLLDAATDAIVEQIEENVI
jgi:protein-tyrosine phosphatase|tara:strand:+ start:13815 stop:14282 length:468 start_codon:yes stop_codon:yes gene_type:complete